MDPCVDSSEAVQHGWMELWYQPKIDAHAVATVGAEGLLRARHPSLGIVPPKYFVETPGECRLRAISEAVIKRVTNDWYRLLVARSSVEIAINLPIAFLRDEGAFDYLFRHLPDHSNFPGLIIEIDSIEIVSNWALAKAISNILGYRNIAISIDHAGAKGTWLHGLGDFPFVEIKIDPSFVRGCATDKNKQTRCRELLKIAQGYGARTVAEGVETWPDFFALRDIGCEVVQGLLFAKPTPIDQFARSCWTDAWQEKRSARARVGLQSVSI